MSDMRKWLTIIESVPATFPSQEVKSQTVKRDATVMVDPRIGGGTGRFMYSTPNGAMIDVKGVAREMPNEDWSLPERDYEDPYEKGNDWFHMSQEPDTIGTMNDKPEFRPGDMVKIADVYGTVIGPGFGIFVAYSTSGQECIISFDDKQIVVPTENVGAVLEQNAKDKFNTLDNDGVLSPMSLGSSNVKFELSNSPQEPEMDHRDDFSKWIATVEEALSIEGGPTFGGVVDQVGDQCCCNDWDCPACFPDQEMPGLSLMPQASDMCPTCGQTCDGHQDGIDGMDGIDGPSGVHGMVEIMPDEYDTLDHHSMMDEEEMDEEEMDEEEMDFHQTEKPKSGKGVKLGDIVQSFVPSDTDGRDSPMTYGEENLDEGDWYNPELSDVEPETSWGEFDDSDNEESQEMISTIGYMQSMGLSKADRDYSEAELATMDKDSLKQCYNAVTGEVSEDNNMQQDMNSNIGPSAGGGVSSNTHYAPGTAPTMPESTNFKGQLTMEKADKDVVDMINRLKQYDNLTESKMGLSEKKGGKPQWLIDAEKKAEGKEVKVDSKDGKSESKDKDKDTSDKKDKIEEGADPEVLEWMSRFAKLGNMKGY